MGCHLESESTSAYENLRVPSSEPDTQQCQILPGEASPRHEHAEDPKKAFQEICPPTYTFGCAALSKDTVALQDLRMHTLHRQTCVDTKALAVNGAGQPPQTAALHHTLNPGCPRAASAADRGTPAHHPAAPSPPGGSVSPWDLRSWALAASPSEPVTRLPRPSNSPLPAPRRPSPLSASRSRYPAWPQAWKPCAPPPPPPLPGLSSGAVRRAGPEPPPRRFPGPAGRGRRSRCQSAGKAGPGGQRGRRRGLARPGAGRRWRRGGRGGGSGPYKRRGQGGREASVRPMCRPPGAGVGAARAMRAGWAGGRRGAKRSRLGA
ncbi:uncharacterized protein LOC114619261 [Grammomys surdaster]|uniref:uncharacterized protein LOC114619261 n=1 Tax=Grammomys surdaster TaxID=491861 RepID=UPI0010A0B21C|nr:uncharacterized protein LOC114619261 [Grammomys surdaster]